MSKIMQQQIRFTEFIDQAARRTQSEVRRSTLGHREALEELWEVWNECGQPNWDGYHALPVDQDTYQAAYRLIESLPLGFPRPSLGAQPDGMLTLEWYRSPTRTFSISINPDGFIHYAGLFGSEEHCGTVPIFDGLPDKVQRLACEV